MVTDVEVVTTREDFLTRFEPWRGDHLPREGESVWIPDHGRRRVQHVIHAPLDSGVTLVVSAEQNNSHTPGQLARGEDGGTTKPNGGVCADMNGSGGGRTDGERDE